MKAYILFFASIVMICLSCNSLYGRTWYIKTDWTGDAPTIAAAIDSASVGDTILAAPGKHITGNDIGLNIEKDIHLISELGPTHTSLSVLHTYEGDHVVDLLNLSTNSSLVGFTIYDSNPWMGLVGGIFVRNSSTTIENNIIRDNSPMFGGAGGILCFDGGSPVIKNNLIYNNTGGVGAAIHVWDSGATIESNTIAYNLSFQDYGSAGTIVIDTDQPVILSNNIIAFNLGSLTDQIAGIYCVSEQTNVTFSCNCIFGNQPYNFLGYCSDPTGMNGNISVNPEFCAVKPDSTKNFYIQSDSPCMPGNHPDGYSCGLIGCRPVGCDTVGVEIGSWNKIKDIYR